MGTESYFIKLIKINPDMRIFRMPVALFFIGFLQHSVDGCYPEIQFIGHKFDVVIVFVKKFFHDADVIFPKAEFIAE